MDRLSNVGIWFNRILLLLVSILFVMISTKYLFNPLASAAESNIVLSSATALSVARVSMGAIPLAIAVITFITIFSQKQIIGGLYIVFVLTFTVTLVRIISLRIDGPSAFGQKVLLPEITITVLSAIGLYLELRRRTKSKKADLSIN